MVGSADPKVSVTVDCARLQTMSLRSVRRMIAEQPDYLLYHVSPTNLPRWKEGAEYYLACAKSGKDPFADMISGVRPVRSKIDGQLLLYKFRLPKDYDPGKKYPLRVDLHAGGGFTWLAYWVTGRSQGRTRHHRPQTARRRLGMDVQAGPQPLSQAGDLQDPLAALRRRSLGTYRHHGRCQPARAHRGRGERASLPRGRRECGPLPPRPGSALGRRSQGVGRPHQRRGSDQGSDGSDGVFLEEGGSFSPS